jgi:pterin-4a-carbinolamine dehydratase
MKALAEKRKLKMHTQNKQSTTQDTITTQETEKPVEKPVEKRKEAVSKKRRPPRPDDIIVAESRLRSERVELAVKKLRGWRSTLDRAGIDRMRRFPNGRVAAAYAAYVAHHATEWRQPVNIHVSGSRVTVVLTALPGRRGEQILNGKTIAFAQEIG